MTALQIENDIDQGFKTDKTLNFNYDESFEEDQSEWSYLPDLVMEKIFAHLSMKEKYWASMVCRNWYRAFQMPKIWSKFKFEDTTLTRRRFNYYSGWQHFLDHYRTQCCLASVGKNFKVLEFAPMYNFHNMYDFMNNLSYYAEMQGTDKWTVKGIGNLVHTLKYTFPCTMAVRHQHTEMSRLYGTGGKLLEAVKRLMRNLPNLKRLELIDLMLDSREALTLLDEVCADCCGTLQTLHLVNPTKLPCQLLHVGVFVNLQTLVISPHNLGEDVLYLIGQTKLKNLHIIQNRYCPVEVRSVCAKTWSECSRSNPLLRVHLSLESLRERNLIWQEKAPVASISLNSPHCKMEADILERTVEWYRRHLKFLGFLGLPRYHQPKSFNDRLDPLVLMVCRESPLLTTLILRERVSTASLLLITEACKNLKIFYVRRNAVILRCDWPRNPDWSKEFYQWLKRTSRSYKLTEEAISQKMNIAWKMLSDKEFKNLNPTLY